MMEPTERHSSVLNDKTRMEQYGSKRFAANKNCYVRRILIFWLEENIKWTVRHDAPNDFLFIDICLSKCVTAFFASRHVRLHVWMHENVCADWDV